MSLRFILGRSGSGKTTLCLDEISEKMAREPLGAPLIYLVPEQMTFQSEYKLARSQEMKGMIRAQVFSFTRLAWRLLQEAGGLARYHLNQVGIQMLLVKLVEREKERLRVFSHTREKSGFIKQLEEMLTELKRYTITPEMLEAQREALLNKENQMPQEHFLADKLHDVSLIFQLVEQELEQHYVDGEDYLRLLAQCIPQVPELKEAEIYVDGFHSFTPQERLVLQALMGTARRVTVALTLDRVREEPFDELDLFYTTGQTYQQLTQLAQEVNCVMENPVVLTSGRRFSHESLAHLEAHYDTRPAPAYTGDSQVYLQAAVNRRVEVETIAQEIVRLAREKGYRWREIAILVRQVEEYQPLLETIFQDYEIPIFLDAKRPTLHHPLVELIRSSLEVIAGDWRFEAVVRCLKTELLFPEGEPYEEWREVIDRLENRALAYGIQGKRWHESESWPSGKHTETTRPGHHQDERLSEERLNRLRISLLQPLVDLEREMKEAETVRDRATALYRFLTHLDVPRKLEHLREKALAQGALPQAREHDQIWGAVCDLLDQLVELAGEEVLPYQLFVQMLESGLESMRFAQVPPALDQVVVARLDHSRLSDVKCTFILGANEGFLPAKPVEGGILSEEERAWLAERGMEMAPGGRQQVLQEHFLIYLALASAAERLYISYALADEEGGALLPSVLIKRIRDLFPNCVERFSHGEPQELPAPEHLPYLSRPAPALTYLVSQLHAVKRGQSIPSFWWEAYNWFMDQPSWQRQAQQSLSSLFYGNHTQRLNQELSRSLYGTKLQLSVSRLETFQACPFNHFAAYGLKLNQRQLFRLEAPDIGLLFHAALNKIAEELRRQGRDWAALDETSSSQLAEQAVEELAPSIQREILFSSNRYQYMKRKLNTVVERAVRILSEQARRSGFSPVGLEIGFGPGQPLPPLSLQLPNGVTLELIGRIDRIDQAESSSGMLLRVIDYKSSAKKLDLAEVYYGLALQLLAYLDVVLTHAKQWLGEEALPAGVLYFHVHNPIHRSTRRLPQADLERELFKKFKMRGLLLADLEAVQLMDTSLESGFSDVIPVGISKKTGEFHKRSAVITREQFETVRRYARYKMGEIGRRLIEGEVAINPYRLKQSTPCTWCDYRPVCQFDPQLETNRFRFLTVEKGTDFVEKISKESEGDGDET